MTTRDAAVLENKAQQRKQSKRATFEGLLNKKRAEKEFEVALVEGEDPVSFLFRAIGAIEYDKILSKYPPTNEQKADGGTYDQDRFAPALLSRVCIEPVLDESEWKQIWNSPDWNRGEVGGLFWAAVELCNKGLDLAPIEAG